MVVSGKAGNARLPHDVWSIGTIATGRHENGTAVFRVGLVRKRQHLLVVQGQGPLTRTTPSGAVPPPCTFTAAAAAAATVAIGSSIFFAPCGKYHAVCRHRQNLVCTVVEPTVRVMALLLLLLATPATVAIPRVDHVPVPLGISRQSYGGLWGVVAVRALEASSLGSLRWGHGGPLARLRSHDDSRHLVPPGSAFQGQGRVTASRGCGSSLDDALKGATLQCRWLLGDLRLGRRSRPAEGSSAGGQRHSGAAFCIRRLCGSDKDGAAISRLWHHRSCGCSLLARPMRDAWALTCQA